MYYNVGDSIVDVIYVFLMFINVVIYVMQMEFDNRFIKVEIRCKDEAQEIFNNVDIVGLMAMLFEQEWLNVFQMSFVNIGVGDILKVRMVYIELLVFNWGVCQFVFLFIVGLRFIVNGEFWVGQVSQDFLLFFEMLLNINLRINGGMVVNVECIFYDILFVLVGNIVEIVLVMNLGVDFIVNYMLDDNEIKIGMLLYEGVEENFFFLMI